MHPVNWLFFSRRYPCPSLERLPSSDGIEPLKLLFDRFSAHSLDLERLPSSGGIEPFKLLLYRTRRPRLERLPSSGGIEPVTLLLPEMYRFFILDKLPSSFGMEPLKFSENMNISVSSDNFPSSGDSVPDK